MKKKKRCEDHSAFVPGSAHSRNIHCGSASGADVVKIGYVDLRVALNESEAGKKAKIELESLIKTKQSSIEEKGKSIEKLKGDLKNRHRYSPQTQERARRKRSRAREGLSKAGAGFPERGKEKRR